MWILIKFSRKNVLNNANVAVILLLIYISVYRQVFLIYVYTCIHIYLYRSGRIVRPRGGSRNLFLPSITGESVGRLCTQYVCTRLFEYVIISYSSQFMQISMWLPATRCRARRFYHREDGTLRGVVFPRFGSRCLRQRSTLSFDISSTLEISTLMLGICIRSYIFVFLSSNCRSLDRKDVQHFSTFNLSNLLLLQNPNPSIPTPKTSNYFSIKSIKPHLQY